MPRGYQTRSTRLAAAARLASVRGLPSWPGATRFHGIGQRYVCSPHPVADSSNEDLADTKTSLDFSSTKGVQIRLVGRNPRPLNVCTIVHILSGVVEWDADKAATNLAKHGVDFADAAAVLEDEAALTVSDDDPDEERFVSVGMDALGRVLTVVYTWRGGEPRLISARKANRSERRQYERKR